MKPHVVITNTPDMDFRKDYVALPKNYGTKEYFARQDVRHEGQRLSGVHRSTGV